MHQKSQLEKDLRWNARISQSLDSMYITSPNVTILYNYARHNIAWSRRHCAMQSGAYPYSTAQKCSSRAEAEIGGRGDIVLRSHPNAIEICVSWSWVLLPTNLKLRPGYRYQLDRIQLERTGSHIQHVATWVADGERSRAVKCARGILQ